MNDLIPLQERIGVEFNNENLLKQSLVHRSYINEHQDFPLGHNERLEFLGDAVLEIIVTEYLFESYPQESEGELTNWRASLVNARMLSIIADELGLEEHLFLSKGEAKDTSSKARQFILADAVEALIGAVYLDQGMRAARKFVVKFVLSKLDNILKNRLYFDPKSRFQEIAQDKCGITPHYRVISEFGPDHKKIFEVGLYLGEELVAKAKGSSKQEAQVEAASKGLESKKW